eukprot:COSAG02_NODE_25102_length_669_cov_0.803509_2_plen_51_part_01
MPWYGSRCPVSSLGPLQLALALALALTLPPSFCQCGCSPLSTDQVMHVCEQ